MLLEVRLLEIQFDRAAAVYTFVLGDDGASVAELTDTHSTGTETSRATTNPNFVKSGALTLYSAKNVLLSLYRAKKMSSIIHHHI